MIFVTHQGLSNGFKSFGLESQHQLQGLLRYSPYTLLYFKKAIEGINLLNLTLNQSFGNSNGHLFVTFKQFLLVEFIISKNMFKVKYLDHLFIQTKFV